MKRAIITYLIIFLIPNLLFGQKQAVQKDTVSFYKHSFSVELGMNRASTIGNRYFEPLPLSISSNKYAGFTKLPSIGLQFSIYYEYKISVKIKIRSGVSFISRRRRYESDSITLAVIEQDNSHIQFTKPYIIKYQYTPVNLEIPIYIGYELSRFSVYLGIKAKIATYNISSTKDVSNSVVTNKNFNFEVPKNRYSYFMNLNLYYRLKSDKLKVFTGIDSGIYPGYSGYFYWQLGINVPIKKFN